MLRIKMPIADQKHNSENRGECVSFLDEKEKRGLERIRSDTLSDLHRLHRRSRMSIAQRIVLLIGAALITVCSLFPCWSISFKDGSEQEIHRSFIYESGAKRSAVFVKKWINKDENVRISTMPEANIDYHRLLVEYAMVLSLTAAVFFLVGRRE
jgi:hypothetical protein